MEDFEVAALNGDAYKPTAGFHVADMFVIWPHGSERLMDFLNWDNSTHHGCQFIMENETASHLSLLGIDI